MTASTMTPAEVLAFLSSYSELRGYPGGFEQARAAIEALVAERDALRSALIDAKEWVYQYMDQNDCDIDDDDLDVSICMRKIDAALAGAGHE